LKVKKHQTSSVKAAGGIQLAAGGCKWWMDGDSWRLQVVVAFLDLLD
jgi:hypothetical protein